MYKLAIVSSHPIQYQVPWFRALARVTDLTVFYCHQQSAIGQANAGFGVPFEWDVPLLDGYRFRWLTNLAKNPDVNQLLGCDTPEIADRLAEGGFDACIVCGWYLKSYLQAIRACWNLRIPVLVRGDSQLKTRRSPLKAIVKYLPYRWFLKRIDAHLYVGLANRAYLRSFGVDDERLFFAPHFVDNEFFAGRAEQARRTCARGRLRSEFGAAPDTIVFLFVGKLIDKKRPIDFVEALGRLGVHRKNVRGVIVGSGPLGPAVAERIKYLGAPIVMVGFKNQSELPLYYSACDAIVLPSNGEETWGLVVNEAMSCGLPALVSDAVGCGDDLIEAGRTGLIFPLGDTGQLESAMAELSELLNSRREELRSNVQALIKRYSVEASVSGTMAAIDWLSQRTERQVRSVGVSS